VTVCVDWTTANKSRQSYADNFALIFMNTIVFKVIRRRTPFLPFKRKGVRQGDTLVICKNRKI
jgi:hypothetical protein